MTIEDWWLPERHMDRRPFLLARNSIQSALRAWFVENGFTEVDPSILQKSPGNEVHLHAFKTENIAIDGTSLGTNYLHTSPEFAMKKLMAAGETHIFTFTHAFRNRESSPLHASEFTMLEWYRAGASLENLMHDCEHILRVALRACEKSELRHKQHHASLALTERISLCDAFFQYAGVDLLSTLCDPANPNTEMLRQQTDIRTAADDTWSDIFTRILIERIEPAQNSNRATFLYDYPKPEAALARTHPRDPRIARRFELYACGLELANAFEELTDAREQRVRFEMDMQAKDAIYGERYPIDESFLRSLNHMPDTSGIALGFDRLVMLVTGAERIDQVLWVPPAA